MQQKNKHKLFLGAVLVTSLLVGLTQFGVKDVKAGPYTNTAPTGYHLTFCGGCESYTVGSVETHSITSSSSTYQGEVCGACRANWTHRSETYYYDCSSKGRVVVGSVDNMVAGTNANGDWCSGTHWSYSGPTGSVTCYDHISTAWFCPGHVTANSYTVYYSAGSDSIAVVHGSASASVKYDQTFALHNGSGFYKSRDAVFIGNTGNASTVGTSATRTATAPITRWDRGALSQSARWNFTSQDGGSVTLTAQYGSFGTLTVPAVTREGYTLLGYTKIEANAGVKMDGSTANVQYRVGDNITPSYHGEKYYAIWAPNQYNIAFNGNGIKYDSGAIKNAEFYAATTDDTSVAGSTPTLTGVKFDGSFTMPNNGFIKIGKGYYGQKLGYTLIGWSQSPFSSYIPNNNHGYVVKTTLQSLSYATYRSGSKTANTIYFYPNETIKNYQYNGFKNQYNLSTGGETITLYANWMPENQRPYTYFRLATKDYYKDGTWTGKIKNIAYDSYPSSISATSGNVTLYEDMPIYLNTMYYDPEGRIANSQFTMEYQYSFDGTNWYLLEPNITTPYFTTKLVTTSTANVTNSVDLNGNKTIQSTSAITNYIYGNNLANTTATTYMLEINFKSTKGDQPVYIRSRASDTVDYPIYLTNVTRNEETNAIVSSTRTTLQKTLWSTNHFSKAYSTSNPDGTVQNDYTGAANSWNGQKAFVQTNTTGVADGTTNYWYTKIIKCYDGNKNPTPDFDNKSDMTYPMWDYTTNNDMYFLVSQYVENKIINEYGSFSLDNVFRYRGYYKQYDNGTEVNFASKYMPITKLILESKSNTDEDGGIHHKYNNAIASDETIGIINLSLDKDGYKHYSPSDNPTYAIDNSYTNKYYHTGDNKDNIQFNNQFSLYFIAIYDENGNELIKQGGNNQALTYDTNGIPVNGSTYTLGDVTGHIYTSYDNMITDFYNRTNGMFAEYSDILNGKYEITLGVCDKSWNIYSPNKWGMEKSVLYTTPRLSFYDINIGDFKQSGYKNEDKAQSLFLKLNGITPVEVTISGESRRIPVYRLSGLTQRAAVSGHNIYISNRNTAQRNQRWALNTDYVADSSLGTKPTPTYKIKAGYNFSINVETSGADYVQVELYNANNPSQPVELIAKTSDKIFANASGTTYYANINKAHSTTSFTFAFPEQTTVGDKFYAKVMIKESTLTHTTHELSSTNLGSNTLTRTFQLGDASHPLFDIDESSLEDIGVELNN